MAFATIPWLPMAHADKDLSSDGKAATPQKQTYQQKRKEAGDFLDSAIKARKPKSKNSAAAVANATAVAAPLAAANQMGFNPAVDYTKPNFANSPVLRKFVDTLPGLGYANRNKLGQYIPVAIPDTATYPGSDYYELTLKEYHQQLHSDLPAAGTTLRGYAQANTTDSTVRGVNQYLGPLIIAKRDRPVRLKFTNLLPTGLSGNLFLPVDTTVMGAGMGPLGMAANPMNYSQNRANIHLHGGFTPWISDGTPHQWVTPAGETTSYPKGVSFQNVPDMVGTGKSIPSPTATDGMGTYYYP
ncbi:MAG TPA: hypothetical protein VGK71_04845, partial [Nitrospirota bacterium]